MRKSPIEMLLDEKNTENIVFYDENQNPMEFEQIALITLDEEQYTILHPVNMGYQDDEVIVYKISTSQKEFELLEVEDEALLSEIYETYKKLNRN